LTDGVTYLKYCRNLEFWLTLILLLATATSSIAAYALWYSLTFFVGTYLFIHWLGLTATIFIIVSIPIHYILKRKKPQTLKTILRIHVFGNLFAFLLISLHFAQNVGRLAGSIQRLGEGFASYLILALIVATGILDRYQTNRKSSRYAKFIHKYTVIVLYLIALIHLLEGFNIL
jgi:hypothetical protein